MRNGNRISGKPAKRYPILQDRPGFAERIVEAITFADDHVES